LKLQSELLRTERVSAVAAGGTIATAAKPIPEPAARLNLLHFGHPYNALRFGSRGDY